MMIKNLIDLGFTWRMYNLVGLKMGIDVNIGTQKITNLAERETSRLES